MEQPPAAVVILAAGAGTRMKSRTPKVLNRMSGRTMLGHAIAAAREVGAARLCVVVRHERDAVADDALATDPDVLIADQDDIPGTGRAVQCGLDTLASAGASLAGTVVVTYADTPLLDGATLAELVTAHTAGANAVTVLTARVPDPAGYGRIVRENGAVVAIVEDKDCTDAQREIDEVNTGVYAFDGGVLTDALARVGSANAQGEVYLTDVLGLAATEGRAVQGIAVEDTWTIEGANDKVQLAQLAAEMNRRIVEGWMREGVTVIDPATTWVDVDVELDADVVLLPNVQLLGATRVESGARIGPDVTLRDAEVGAGAKVVRSHVEIAVVGAGAQVGPYAVLRPGATVPDGGEVPAFTELHAPGAGGHANEEGE